MDNYWGVTGKKARTTSNDSVDGIIVKGSVYILRLSFLIQVRAKVVFLDHVYIDVFAKLWCGVGVKGLYECWVGCWFLFEISFACSHWVWK